MLRRPIETAPLIGKDWLEERLVSGLRDAVLQPEALKYAIEAFRRQIEEASRESSRDIEQARADGHGIQGELDRLIAAVASGGHSAALLQAIEQRERQRHSSSGIPQVPAEEITKFVVGRLSRLPRLLNTDVTQARAELLRHVAEIRLAPRQTAEGPDYVAEGEWDLLGNQAESDRARHLSGVRARLVAGVGFEPTTSGL